MDSEEPTIAHPIFEVANDPRISECLLEVFNDFNDRVDDGTLLSYFFAVPVHEIDESLDKMKAKIKLSVQPTCGKMLSFNETYFWCIECDKLVQSGNEHTCLCQPCFEKSDHLDHRVIILTAHSEKAFCDCGDFQIFSEKGFCWNHKTREVSYEEVRQDLGPEFADEFVEKVKVYMYCLISMMELSLQGNGFKNELLDYDFMILIETINYLKNFIHPCFSILFAEAFVSVFQEPAGSLLHDCDLMSEEKGTLKTRQCKCMILELLFRYIRYIGDDVQNELVPLFAGFSKSKKFRDNLIVLLLKYTKQLYYEDYPARRNDENWTSRMESVLSHIFSDHDMRMKGLNSGYFHQLLDMMNVFLNRRGEWNDTVLISDLTSKMKAFYKDQKCTEFLIEENGLLTTIIRSNFELRNNFPSKKMSFDINSDELDLQKFSVLFLKQSVGLASIRDLNSSLENCKIEQGWNKMLKAIKEDFLKLKELLTENNPTLFPIFERSLSILARGSKLYINPEQTKKFLLSLELPVEEVVEEVIDTTLRTMSSISLINSLFPALYQVMKYYKRYVSIMFNEMALSTDIVTLQTMISAAEKIDFGILYKGFFWLDQELLDFFGTFKLDRDNKHFRNRIKLLDEFLFLMIHLCQDEAALINELTANEKQIVGDDQHSALVKRVTEKYISAILCTKLVPSNVLQETMKEYLNIGATSESLQIMTDKDASGKLKLKPSYYKNIDPYLIFTHKSYTEEVAPEIAKINSKELIIDPVSGITYTDLPEYLYSIQSKILSSQFLKFLEGIILHANKNGLEELVKHSLKLILLRIDLELIVSKSEELKKKIVVENLKFEESTLALLKETLTDPKAKIFHPCITKILTYHSMSAEVKSMMDEESKIDDKKAKALAKRKELEEKFKSSRDAFAKKNNEEFSAINVEQESELVKYHCHICNSEINPKTEQYCYPLESYLIPPLQNMKVSWVHESDPIMAFRSCRHSYHRKCFDEWVSTLYGKFNLDKVQIYCPICKQGLKTFIPVPDKSNKPKIDGEENDVYMHQIAEFFELKITTPCESFVALLENSIYHFIVKTDLRAKDLDITNQLLTFRDIIRFYRLSPSLLFAVDYVPDTSRIDKNFVHLGLKSILQESEDFTEIVEHYLIEKLVETLLLEDSSKENCYERLLSKASEVLKNPDTRDMFWDELQIFILRCSLMHTLKIWSDSDMEKYDQICRYTKPIFSMANIDFIGKNLPFDEFVLQTIEKNLEYIEEIDLNPEELDKEAIFLQNLRVKSRISVLPENYQEFCNIYFKKKCSFCKELPKDAILYICLLCGDFFCMNKCINSCYYHAREAHSYQAIYLNSRDLTSWIVYNGLKVRTKQKFFYVSPFGESICSHFEDPFTSRVWKYDFKTFKLNKSTVKYFEEVLDSDSIPAEFTKAFINVL